MPWREPSGDKNLRKVNLEAEVSDHFRWIELLRSDVAERHQGLLKQQLDPSFEVEFNLTYLTTMTLEPIRVHLGVPIRVSSGYRCKALNKLVGGSPTSQHVVGEAADLNLWRGFTKDILCTERRQEISESCQRITGYPLRTDINANFYLCAWVALHLDELDIDQVIHEYGQPGRPAWVHISASRRQNRRQILTATARGYRRTRLKTLLKLGSQTND